MANAHTYVHAYTYPHVHTRTRTHTHMHSEPPTNTPSHTHIHTHRILPSPHTLSTKPAPPFVFLRRRVIISLRSDLFEGTVIQRRVFLRFPGISVVFSCLSVSLCRSRRLKDSSSPSSSWDWFRQEGDWENGRGNEGMEK